jgi:hypothetical protein
MKSGHWPWRSRQRPGDTRKNNIRVSISVSAVRHACRADHEQFAGRLSTDHEQESRAMNTLLITTQIVCYSVGIVSASLNIASFVRVRRVRRKRREQLAAHA